MRVLALDTTTREGSVALVEHDRVVAEIAGDRSRSHAERLPGDLDRAAAAAGWRLADVDVLAVVAGPGSFTGLRIGIATMQGLAFVLGRPIVPVSALEALAQRAAVERSSGSLVAAWIDAHRHEVFSALYRVTDAPPFSAARLATIEAPSVGAPGDILARWRAASPAPDVLTGDGAALYASLLDGLARSDAPLLAGAAGLIASSRARDGEAVHPSAVHPIYIRRPDAEITRERDRATP
jgi:tRNA threonylcarbamoyladenosine biosynthesis protein TsaB